MASDDEDEDEENADKKDEEDKEEEENKDKDDKAGKNIEKKKDKKKKNGSESASDSEMPPDQDKDYKPNSTQSSRSASPAVSNINATDSLKRPTSSSPDTSQVKKAKLEIGFGTSSYVSGSRYTFN